MSRFPKVSETFILNEIIELERLGMQVEVFPLIRQREAVVHAEARDLVARAHYQRPLSRTVAAAQLHWLWRAPGRYLGAWWRALWGSAGSPPALARALYVVPQAAAAARLMTALEVDRVHAHFANVPALSAYIVHRLTGLPYSFTVHAYDLFVERTMLGEKLAAADFAVTISDYNRRLLAQLYGPAGRRAHVIRCGVDTAYFRPTAHGRADAPFTVVCVASLQEYKGQRILLEACDLLARRGVAFRCLLAGDGPDRTDLAAEVDRRGLGDAVTFLGAQPRDAVRRWLARADACALASVRTPDGLMDGIPVALMEALACELPVVATDLSGIGELVEHERTGLLVPERDAVALADALERLARDPALRSRLGRAGRAKVLAEFELRGNVRRLHRLFSAEGAL